MNTKLLFKNLLFASIILLSVSKQVFAVGALFSRPRWSTENYNKMWIQKVNTTVDIQEQVAVTHIDQTFYNELNNSVETIYLFPLPEDATITELVYWVNNQRYVAEIKERQEAINQYNEKLRQWLDPALLEELGDNLFRLSIVPVNALSEVRTEVTYIEPLKYDLGIVEYKFQLNTLGLSSKPLQVVSINLEAQSKYSYVSFTSPSHGNSTATKLEKISDNHYKLFYGDENFYPDKDLVVQFESDRAEVNYHILTYTPSAKDSIGDDSFYALWITPPDQLDSNDVIPKDIVFTADVSSSMEGERIKQVKDALLRFIELLNPVDRFNIITFGTFVEKFKPDLVEASANNLNDAKLFIQNLYALGMTNIDESLKASLQQSYGDSSANNLVFLTDGYPTWGEKNQDSILNHIKLFNTKAVRIFSFGVGDDISKVLLGNISDQNHGYVKFITSDDSIALVVNDHFMRISKPVLTDVNIDFGGLLTWDIYPKATNDLFWGSQIMQLGLYKNAGLYNVAVNGKMMSKPVVFTQQIYFADTIGGHKFVPRLWAKAKINHILGLIEVYGETEELKNQVIELSLKFQILTPYTAMYVDPGTTNVDDAQVKPTQFALEQNYPNPFNPTTTIKFSLPDNKSAYHVSIKIYDLLGRLVRVLVNDDKTPGIYTVMWDSKNSNGMMVPSGTYFYTLEAGDFRYTRKMVLVR